MKALSGKVTSKGQLVIPAELRRRTGMNPGTKVRFLQDEFGRIILQPDSEEYIKRVRGCVRGSNMLETWLEEHRAEGEKEKY
jgi:AbrB family looped-hinge helix DNA binding protein